MNFSGICKAIALTLVLGDAALGQQRPLLTEDPRLVSEGSVVTELGIGYQHRDRMPLTGLTGDHYSLLENGLKYGAGARAEFQITGVVHHYVRLERGGSLNDWGDTAISTKVLLVREGRSIPTVTFRPTVVLPNSNDRKGIGLDTTNFFGSVLAGKTVGGAFLFGNIGLGIMEDAVRVSEQHDVLVYGIAGALPARGRMTVVAEWNGIHNSRNNPSPGGESRGQVRLGVQIKAGQMRVDAAATAGTTRFDHKAGAVVGVSREFRFSR